MLEFITQKLLWISDLGITLLVFLFIFGLLIILHEFGHFWAARAAGVRVLEFGFGLPPKVWGKKTTRHFTDEENKNRTEEMEWTINAIPFGGFVRMHGEGDSSKDPDSFGERPLAWRMLVICGGVIMNFLIGWVLFTGLFLYGIDPNPQTKEQFDEYVSDGYFENHGVIITKTTEGSPAEKIELLYGDKLISIGETPIISAQDVVDAEKKSGEPLAIIVERDGEILEKQIIPDENNLLGIYPQNNISIVKKEQYSIVEAPQKAFTKCFEVMSGSLSLLGDVVKKLTSSFTLPDEIGGPVAIAHTTDKLLEIGDITKLISFMAMISLSLAVINIMPFPGLDGGRFVFLLLELILIIKAWILKNIFQVKREIPTKVPESWEMPFHLLGYLILMSLLLWITWNDVMRIFFG